jgi:hypothetical protein
VALRRGIPGWLHLGSNRRSDTQFWIGWGLVDTTRRRPVDRILSPRHAALLEGALVEVPTDAVALPGFERLPSARSCATPSHPLANVSLLTRKS